MLVGHGASFASKSRRGEPPRPYLSVGGSRDNYVSGIGNPGSKDPLLEAAISSAEVLLIGSAQRTKAMQEVNKELISPADILWVSICQGTNIFVANKKVIGLNSDLPMATLSASPTLNYLEIAK
jgi:hypothetical protein